MAAAQCKKCKIAMINIFCRASHSNTSNMAKTVDTSNAGGLMIAATMASLVIFVLSAYALANIYSWYPQIVAQRWFVYDELLTTFSFVELICGALAASLIMWKKNFRVVVALAMVCTLSGASAFLVTLIQPLAVLWESLLFYFAPLFIIPLAGTLLFYLNTGLKHHGYSIHEKVK
jgi:hypothetical protein